MDILCAGYGDDDFVAGLGAAIRTSLRWRQAEERLIEAERQKTEAELKNLKNQLNPHFLLNTLNNIYALIAFNSDKAQEAVQELSKLLRHVLYDNQQTFVPLEKELDFIRNYVALMRIRLPQQVEVSVNLEADSGGALQIAPYFHIADRKCLQAWYQPHSRQSYQYLYLWAYGWYGEM